MSNVTQPRTPCAVIARDTVVELPAGGRFELTAEVATQYGIDTNFAMSFGPDGYRREYRLGPKDRADFMVEARIVVEVSRNG